jgi:SAM-dependent methyltransferase
MNPLRWLGLWHARRHWRRYAETEPYWAVLTQPDYRREKMDLAGFYATGRVTVQEHLDWARHAAGGMLPDGPALDFGCGVGRLTLGLRQHFPRVVGLDVALPMLELANKASAETAGVEYRLNERADLRMFPDNTFAVVYSHLVLQHLPPAASLGFLPEFARVCRPGGWVLIQLPAEDRRARLPLGRERARRAFWRGVNRWLVGRPAMEIHPVGPERVERALAAGGCRLAAVRPDASAGPEYPGFLYLARKD